MRLSVIIPTFNGARYLRTCLDSIVMQQAGFNWELFVVDDGSTDETQDLITEYTDRFPNLVNYHRIDHAGPSAARNKGIRLSSGEIVLFLDDDVKLPPTFFESLSNFMDRSDVDVLGILDLPLEDDSYLAKSARHLENFSRVRLATPKSAAIAYKRKVLEQVGLFDEDRLYYQAEDTEHVLRSSQAGFTVGFSTDLFLWHRSSGLKNYIKKGLLSLRSMGAPNPFSYYRVKYGLLTNILAIIFMYFLYMATVPTIIAGFFIFIGAVLTASYMSWVMSASLAYWPGIIIFGTIRVFLIMYASLRYLWFKKFIPKS